MNKDINGFMVRVEGHIQLFWYDPEEDTIFDPSVPIGESDDGYYKKELTDKHIWFCHVIMKPKDESIEPVIETYEDYDNFIFETEPRERIILNAPAEDLMKEGKLCEMISDILANIIKKDPKDGQ